MMKAFPFRFTVRHINRFIVSHFCRFRCRKRLMFNELSYPSWWRKILCNCVRHIIHGWDPFRLSSTRVFFLHLQTFPIAASSLCLLMLSLDRYATVKHPRFTQLRQRQYLPSVLAIVSWVGASVLCIPFLLVYKVTTSSTAPPPLSNDHQLATATSFSYRDSSLISDKKLCISDYGSDQWHIVFIVSYVGFAFVVPCCGIIFNHLGRWLSIAELEIN